MPRSVKKGPFVDSYLIDKINAARASNDRRPIKTWSRRSTIMPEMVGFTMAIHNGRAFVSVYVTEDMIGHKLGEFSMTRTFRSHTAGDKKTKGPGDKK